MASSTLLSTTLLVAGHCVINPSLSSALPQKSRDFAAFSNKRAFSSRLRTTYSAPYVGRVMASTGVGPKAGYATSSMSTNESVVSVDWLHSNLKEADIKVLDASWYMPHDQRNPIQEYQVAHIPGALFFDVDRISDRSTNLPHMLPSEEAFAAACSALGIENKDGVVVYDDKIQNHIFNFFF